MTAYVLVPGHPVPEKPNSIRVAQVPSGNSWNRTAENVNYFLGTGHQLIPASMLTRPTMNSGSNYAYSFRVATRPQSLEQRWEFHFSASATPGRITNLSINGHLLASTVNIPANSKVPVYALFSTSSTAPFVTYEVTFSCSVLSGSSANQRYWLQEIAAFEIPRMELDVDQARDLPVDDSTVRPATLIYASATSITAPRQSLGGVVAALSSSYTTHLGGLFTWAVPYRSNGADYNDTARRTCNTSVTSSNVFAIDPKVQLRNMSALTQSSQFATHILLRSTSAGSLLHFQQHCVENGTSTGFTATVGTSWAWVQVPTGSLRFPTDLLAGSSNGLPAGFTKSPSMRFVWKLDPANPAVTVSMASISMFSDRSGSY